MSSYVTTDNVYLMINDGDKLAPNVTFSDGVKVVSLRVLAQQHQEMMTEMKHLKATIQALQKMVDHLTFAPGGPGFAEARAEFEAKALTHLPTI
jgi:hypothetical protein